MSNETRSVIGMKIRYAEEKMAEAQADKNMREYKYWEDISHILARKRKVAVK
ncbi:MAG: hypothetical protein LBT45_02435 [Rickettsiales bacterium]|jgi:hypothetical protein|nr:hypothetical protein [Rickettsiales bacterium]